MNYFTTSIFQSLIRNDNQLEYFEQTVAELFRSELEKALNEILDYELTAFLDYERYARSDNENARNGSYMRKLDTKYGQIELKIPRDRLGEFYTTLLPKYRRRDFATESTILDLFEQGMSNSEITRVIQHLCGANYSKQTISNITDKALTSVEAFKNRTLHPEYAVIFLDATSMAVRRDTVSKEMVHIALGIRVDGSKEILGYMNAPTESAEIWRDLLNQLKERGLERVSLFCTDGLAGMESVIESTFPMSKIQRCLVHVQRNINSKVRHKDQKEVASDFKKTYRADSKEEAQEAYKFFIKKWSKKYPKMTEALDKNTNLFTFYEYPKSVRSSIYSTNIIESYNKQLKRNFKKKEQFPTEQAEEKYLVCEFNKYNEKHMIHAHRGFAQTIQSDWFKD